MQIRKLSGNYSYSLYDIDISSINEVFIQTYSAASFSPEEKGYLDLFPAEMEINAALFESSIQGPGPIHTTVIKEENNLHLGCSCNSVSDKLCSHQSRALYNILNRQDLRIFFDDALRLHRLRIFAEPYGLQDAERPGDYFLIEYKNSKTIFSPVSPNLFPVSKENNLKISEQLLPPSTSLQVNQGTEQIVIFKQHRYYRHLNIELMQTAVTQTGKPKNPLIQINAQEMIWKTTDAARTKFYSAVNLFRNRTVAEDNVSSLEALKAILKNPLSLRFYQHLPEVSENITAGSLKLLNIGNILLDVSISVVKKSPFFEITAAVLLQGKQYGMNELHLRYSYFLDTGSSIHLAGNQNVLKLAEFFKEHNDKLLIHESKYEEFRDTVLSRVENYAEILYSYLKPATKEQIADNKLDLPPQRYILLRDSDPFIEIDPVMKYGEVEIPVLSKKQIYPKGIKSTFSVNRDKEAELSFIALIIKQHSYFEEQLQDGLPCFYLHKKHFLNEEWFLNVFEEWQNEGIGVLGFNKINNNKLNPDKVKITIRVLSGTDWFNAEVSLVYGRKKARLQQVKKAVRNKSRYVQLDDGTYGILPDEWISKFRDYFNAGEVMDDTLKIPKNNFRILNELFDENEIDNRLKSELDFLNEKLQNFETIQDVPVPEALNANLREYQQQGLNWLNFLDDFNFGGCLADDMGLGKSLQIIAFILSQRAKRAQNTNLLVVPTSLIFSWQAEVFKFAPSLKICTMYGAGRIADTSTFKEYELILTSYGTLLSDVRFLKNYTFNYIFLDESQNIKNPDSQRYKAACLLKSRNKIVITGTPVENNTFDLFGQLSFACPGLLGSKQYFRDIYSIPVDRFKDRKRAAELQDKIRPFILRRTKKQVAAELPDKTEMVIHCEMGPGQQKIYDAVEKEFREYINSKTEDEMPGHTVHILKGLTLLRQICNSPRLLNDEDIAENASSKIDTLVEQIELKSPRHKILVFSQFVSMLDLIKKELELRDIGFSYLSGSTRNREQTVQEFQDDNNRRVFLISLKAGGTGLNLTQADYVYLVDPWWNPAVENQAIDRVYRIGQKKNVVAVRLICPGTIEEKILEMQQSKNELFNDLINTDPAVSGSLTKENLLKLLG